MKKLAVVLTFVFQLGCSVFGIRNEETPKYQVLETDREFEVREYAPHIVAATQVQGAYEEAQNKAFRALAGYIFGDNEKKEKISMTAPVVQAPKSEKIAMTAPVIQSPTKSGWEMTFSMPSSYKLEDLPKPKNPDVELKMMDAKTFAVLGFTGFWDEKRIKAQGERLLEWLDKQSQYEAVSLPMFAGYNPPWTLPFLRKNEVLVEVRKKYSK